MTCLQAVHRREQSLNLLMGLITAWAWIMGLFLVALTVDWWLEVPSPGRFLVLACLLGAALYKAWGIGWRHFTGLDLRNSALKVENHYSNLESLLVTGVQFDAERARGSRSNPMADLTIRRAEDAADGLDAQQVVPYRPLHEPTRAAVMLAVILAVFAVANGPMLMAGLQRIFLPWQVVVYPTRTQIDLGESQTVVREGDPCLLYTSDAADE